MFWLWGKWAKKVDKTNKSNETTDDSTIVGGLQNIIPTVDAEMPGPSVACATATLIDETTTVKPAESVKLAVVEEKESKNLEESDQTTV